MVILVGIRIQDAVLGVQDFSESEFKKLATEQMIIKTKEASTLPQ